MTPSNLQNYIDQYSSIFWIGSDIQSILKPIEKDLLLERKPANSLFQVNQFKKIKTGYFNDIYYFNDFYEKEYILKIGLLPYNYSFSASFWASNELKSLDVSTPEIILSDTSRYLVNFDYQIQKMIHGKSLKWYYENNYPLFESYLKIIGKKLFKFHQIHLPRFGHINPKCFFSTSLKTPYGIFDSWEKFLLTNFKTHADTCLEINAINEKEYENILSFEKRFCLDDFIPTLLHNDLSKDNIFITEDENITFLDLDNLIIGDPIFDLANFCSFNMPKTFSSFIDSYYQKEGTPKNFNFKFWLYYLRIVLARTIHRHKYGLIDDPKYPPASNRIKIALEKLN